MLKKYHFLKRIEDLPFVEAIYLFGSRATLDHEQKSDIDLAIVCPKATQAQWYSLLEIIDDADTLLAIDCVRFDKLKADDPLKIAIQKNHQVLYNAKNE